MKKRSFLVLLAAGALMLAGCFGGGKKSSSTSPDGSSDGGSGTPGSQSSQPGGDADIAPTEGKTTFYFQFGAGTPELPSYTSIFLTGGFIGWKEAVGQAIEMQKQGDYYVGLVDELEVGSTAEKYYEFQLTAGYNATSGAPSTGVNWSYKSNECKAAGGDAGLDNLSFEVVNGLVNLGSHTWDEFPPDPAASAIHNFKIEAKFAAAVPEYVDLYLVGDHLAWSFDETTQLVPNADRTSFTQTIETILGNTYGVKLMAQYHGQATDWNHAVLADGANNYNMVVKKTWGNDYTLDLAAQAYDAFIIDHEVFTIDWAEFMPALGDEVDVSLKLVAASALDYAWEARGSWVADWSEAKALTANEAKTEFTADLGSYAAGNTIQFKIKLVETWSIAIGDKDGENIQVNVSDEDMLVVVTLDADLTAELAGKIAEFKAGTLAADYTAHAAVSGNGAAPAFVPADHSYSLIGAFGGHNWDTDVDMAKEEGQDVWKATVELAANDQLKIRLDHDWTNSYGFAQVVSAPEGAFVADSGNIKCVTAGTYQFTLSFVEGAAQIAIATVA